jgi:hypothetical protein
MPQRLTHLLAPSWMDVSLCFVCSSVFWVVIRNKVLHSEGCSCNPGSLRMKLLLRTWDLLPEWWKFRVRQNVWGKTHRCENSAPTTYKTFVQVKLVSQDEICSHRINILLFLCNNSEASSWRLPSLSWRCSCLWHCAAVLNRTLGEWCW